MTERKKPGPKPKCKECGRKEGEGHYDDCPVGMGVVQDWRNAGPAMDMGDSRVPPAYTESTTPGGIILPQHQDEAGRAQAYAKRVWDGQSVSLPRAERLKRVAKALEGQGLSMEGVEL